MLKVGVVGATGYAGEEVIKILVNHKCVKITELSAVIDKEEPISSIFPGFKGKIDLVCKKPNPEAMAKNLDLVFLGALASRLSFLPALRARRVRRDAGEALTCCVVRTQQVSAYLAARANKNRTTWTCVVIRTAGLIPPKTLNQR